MSDPVLLNWLGDMPTTAECSPVVDVTDIREDEETHMKMKRDLCAGLKSGRASDGDHLELVTAPCDHMFHEVGRKKAYEFLERHLAR